MDLQVHGSDISGLLSRPLKRLTDIENGFIHRQLYEVHAMAPDEFGNIASEVVANGAPIFLEGGRVVVVGHASSGQNGYGHVSILDCGLVGVAFGRLEVEVKFAFVLEERPCRSGHLGASLLGR